MPLGTEVGLSPGNFVLDGNPAPLLKKGSGAPTPIFGTWESEMVQASMADNTINHGYTYNNDGIKRGQDLLLNKPYNNGPIIPITPVGFR